MTTTRSEQLLKILQEYFSPREEGWLWLALYADARDPGLVNQIEGEYEDAHGTATALGRIINEAGTDHAYLAMCRAEGRPREADRELWRELRRLISADRLEDLVVFNQRHAWSMRAEDVAAA